MQNFGGRGGGANNVHMGDLKVAIKLNDISST